MADAYGGSGGMVGYNNDYYSPENVRDRADRDNSAFRSTATGGAMSGAGTGAMLGSSVAGPWGALFGGLFGGAGGALKGMLNAGDAEKERRRKERAWEEAKKSLARERYQARVATHAMLSNAYSPANAWMKQNYGGDAGQDLNKTPWGTVDPNNPPQAQNFDQYGGARTRSSSGGGKAPAKKSSSGSSSSGRQTPSPEPAPAGKPPRKPRER
jgi:gas vesicle protein